MSEINNDVNFVEALRSKSEEIDIKQYLKSNLGGYTKSSVLEYLSLLRKQQQSMAETFSCNQQALFDEKEKLKKNNDALKARLNQIESEYRNLSDAMRSNQLVEEGFTAADMVALKNRISALEEDINKNSVEKSLLEDKIEQQGSIVNDYINKLEQSHQEKLSLKEMLKAEMIESKKQRNIVLQLSGKIEKKDQEIKFLSSQMADGQLAILTCKISELTDQIKDQTGYITECNNRNGLQAQIIETINDENSTLRQSIDRLIKDVEEFREQNDKLLFANQSLAEQLKTEYQRLIDFIKEKSNISMDKFSAVRKLDQANAKITVLELQLEKIKGDQETESVLQSSCQTEEIKLNLSLGSAVKC